MKNGQLSCSEESDDSQSDYFADAENSSCISLELDSDWSDTEDMVEPTNSFCIPPELDGNWSDSEDRVEPINSSCSSLELDSDWSDSEDLVEPINSSCSWLELESDWTDSEDRVEGVYQSLWILYSMFNGNYSLSAYEVKNNCCLFKRLFKIKKNGISLFEISSLVFEIFTFLYNANEESDDVINCPKKKR